MAKLPSFRRILEQDYPEESRPLVQQLSVSINYGIEVLYDLLNGKLSIKDNLAGFVKEIDVQVDTTGKPQDKTVIKKTTSDKIEGLMVIRADNLTNSNIYPTNGVFVSFTETTDSLIINNITGIQPNNIYRLKLWAVK